MIHDINLNPEVLYRAGQVAACPICGVEHFEALRDIHQGDRIVSSQVKLFPAIPMDLENISDTCQFCYGGNTIVLLPTKRVKVYETES